MNRKIKKGLCVFIAFLSIGYGGYKLLKGAPEKHYPYCVEFTHLDPTLSDEIVYNGIRYLPPTDEYRLEIINNHVSAVRRYYLVYELNGFNLKDGDVVSDGEVFRSIETRAEPIVADKQKKIGEKD